MSETRKRFDVHSEIREYLLSAVKKVTGIIPLIKEEASISLKLSELEGEEDHIIEQINSLKISLKLVEKEEIKKAIEEIISLKEKELKKNREEKDKLNLSLAEYSNEIEDYELYITQVYLFTDDFDFIDEDFIEFEKFSRDEFIAYIFIQTNSGESSFPRYDKADAPIILHEIIDFVKNHNWNSFIDYIEKMD